MQYNKIAIIGMGVVGTGMMKLLQRHYNLVLYDTDSEKLETLETGHNNGYYTVTTTNKNDVQRCDLAIVCVPTPMNQDGSCNTDHVQEVISWCNCPHILIKSTVPPGTCRYLSEKYNKSVHFSPEYMGESSYFTPFWKYPDPQRAETHTFVIVGGPEASSILQVFMKCMSVDTKYIPATWEEAELCKYMENCFFATKVTFCNEFANIADVFGVDYIKLRELWLLDSRINPNHTMVFNDNRGYGGKCLPKDISAIVVASRKAGYTPGLLTSVIEQNKRIKTQ